jgi:Tol biopolymer transport system component
MIGKTLQQYRVLERIGAGGMGEVYRATDTRLGRDVAIKILPPAMAQDADRLARFDREARALAALNHPHIAALHGLEESEGLRFLVMEFVPGVSLTGPLPLEEALPLLLQVAEALEASHEKGIIHRDLKPANIRVTPDGKAKVLDFGLAKAADVSLSYDSSHSPTVGADATREGSVLGTAAYMSPEQLRGRPTDRRADIWAFGCLFCEVLTGRKAFQGDTPSDTTVAILRNEPDWSALPKETPESIRALLRRCVQKDPMRRIRDMGDVRLQLEEAIAELRNPLPTPAAAPSPPARATPNVAMFALLAAALVLAAASAAWWLRGRLAPPQPARTVSVDRLTELTGVEELPAISPDGKSVAFVAAVNGITQIWIRLLAGGAPLQITRDAAHHLFPRWTPDSTTLIYFSPSETSGEGAIWEVSALGGAPRRVLEALSGLDVSHDGRRLAYFRSAQGGIELAVAQRDGSAAQALVKLPPHLAYAFPRWSPDDRWIAYHAGTNFGHDLYVISAGGGEPRRVTFDSQQMAGLAWSPDGKSVVYSSSRGSTVLYLPPLNLWQADLDGQNTRQLTFGSQSYRHPDVNARGDLVASRMHMHSNIWKYPIDSTPAQNTVRAVAITNQTGHVQTPSLSPDDREMVFLSDSGGHSNLWVMDLLTREVRQITTEQSPDMSIGVPIWSPQGRQISHFRRKAGVLQGEQWMVNSDGSNPYQIADWGGWGEWSPDGKSVYYAVQNPQGLGYEIFKVPAEGGPRTTIRTDDTHAPNVSPDGSTLYFVQGLTGLNGVSDLEIRYARPPDAPSQLLVRIPSRRLARWQLIQPAMSPNGRWLAVMLTDGATTNLWGVSTADGSLRQFTDFGSEPTFIARRVAWSSDSRWIYAALGRGDADVVLLRGLLP